MHKGLGIRVAGLGFALNLACPERLEAMVHWFEGSQDRWGVVLNQRVSVLAYFDSRLTHDYVTASLLLSRIDSMCLASIH